MLPHFTYPWALPILLIVPLVAWRYLRQTRGAWQFSDSRLLPTSVSPRVRWAWWGGLLFRLAALACVILALAGPRWVDEKERIPTDGISIVLVLDVSASMGEKDFAVENESISRLLGVQRLFRLFVAGGQTSEGVALPGRKHDLIGLVTFATHPETACPLTLEHQPLLEIMDAQTPRSVAGEGTTNPGDAIAWALHVLRSAPTRRKIIVFLTDGESNVKEKLEPLQSAQLAANLSIPIYAIDAAPEPKNGKERAKIESARDKMKTMAKMTEGQYFRAQDGSGLVKAYENIDKLERDRILSFQYRRYVEGFAWFALAAMMLWLILILMESTLWRRTP
jgi:Ca-activated chloride channel family protein